MWHSFLGLCSWGGCRRCWPRCSSRCTIRTSGGAEAAAPLAVLSTQQHGDLLTRGGGWLQLRLWFCTSLQFWCFVTFCLPGGDLVPWNVPVSAPHFEPFAVVINAKNINFNNFSVYLIYNAVLNIFGYNVRVCFVKNCRWMIRIEHYCFILCVFDMWVFNINLLSVSFP